LLDHVPNKVAGAILKAYIEELEAKLRRALVTRQKSDLRVLNTPIH
jgi:hypothetical protein